MNISTKRLGLAAYIKVNGGKLLGLQQRRFNFESDRDIDDWEIAYSNSCCQQHDTELVNLRKLIKD